MAPEQWLGLESERSDIYSFGILLYELFCNRHPFEVSDPLEYFVWHVEGSFPDPSELRNGIPASLASLMLACVGKFDSRPASFGVVRKALSRIYESIDGDPTQFAVEETKVPKEELLSQSESLRRLGLACLSRGDAEEALRILRRSLELVEELDHGED